MATAQSSLAFKFLACESFVWYRAVLPNGYLFSVEYKTFIIGAEPLKIAYHIYILIFLSQGTFLRLVFLTDPV